MKQYKSVGSLKRNNLQNGNFCSRFKKTKDKRVWVQVAKNFTPHIKLSQEEVQQELFDFEETINVKASEIGTGEHQISAEAYVSWNKHDYTDSDKTSNSSKNYKITVR